MPLPLLSAYVQMLPRMEARALRHAATAAMVGGSLRAKNATSQIKEWASLERGGESGKPGGGLDALVKMRAANERARAAGTLWRPA